MRNADDLDDQHVADYFVDHAVVTDADAIDMLAAR